MERLGKAQMRMKNALKINGQGENYSCTFVYSLALQPDFAPMRFDQLFGNGQTNPTTTACPRPATCQRGRNA